MVAARQGVDWRAAWQARLLFLLVVGGILERYAWFAVHYRHGHRMAAGEAVRVAVHLARGQGFAGAYMFTDAPTAHLLPIPPIIAGVVYRLLGVGALPAELVLVTWSIGLAVGVCLLLDRAFARLGTPAAARLLASGTLLLGNPFIGSDVIDFRVWEGGLAAFLAAVWLDRLTALLVRPAQPPTRWMALAALAALTFFVNPVLGLAAIAGTGIAAMRNLPFAEAARIAAVGALALGLMIGPWTVRNAMVMGKPIPLRSNAGLELALSMYPGAAAPSARPAQRQAARMTAIHPYKSLSAFRAMQAAGGEVAYFDALGRQARAWVADHPGAAARLALGHIAQAIAPPAWLFDINGLTNQTWLKALLAQAAGLSGVFGLFLALAGRRRDWLYPALLIIVPVLLLAPFQPQPRYIYLFFAPLVFAGADGLATIAFWVSRRARAGPDTRAA